MNKLKSFLWRFKSPFYLIGLYTVGNGIYSIGQTVQKYKYPDSGQDIQDHYGYGIDRTAVVTGGTQGLGKGYAEQLAKRGFNIILISRNESKLKEVAQELEINHGAKVSYIPFDFTSTDPEQYDQLFEKLNKQEIHVFVNNAAVLKKGVLGEMKFSEIKQQIDGNILAPTLLINNFIKYVKSKDEYAEKRILINIGSQSSRRGVVMVEYPYFATKEYMNYISDCTTVQAQGIKNLIVQNNSPGYIDSPMLYEFSESLSKPTFLQKLYIQKPEDIANESLKQINNPLVNGTYNQAILNSLFTTLPFTKKFFT